MSPASMRPARIPARSVPTRSLRAGSLPAGSLRLSRRAALTGSLLTGLAACGYGSTADEDDDAQDAQASGRALSAEEVSIGYFATLTHATAVLGLAADGLIHQELDGTTATTQVFDAGPSAIEALNSGDLDMTFVGPSPTINGYVQSGGANLRIVCGAASGGASLVANPDTVGGLDDLAGKTFATPQLGNTQDVALLSYLSEQGIDVNPQDGSGEATVLRISNSEIPAAYESGDIDGAWVPEPTAATLVKRGAATLLDERELWQDGRFVVTHLIASQDFLTAHRDIVEAVVRGVVLTTDWIAAHPERAKERFNAEIAALPGGATLPASVLDPAFEHVEYLYDPLAGTLWTSAENAIEVELLSATKADLAGVYDLSVLNDVLRQEDLPTIRDDAGLGV